MSGVISQADLDKDDHVYQFLHKKIVPKLLLWVNEILQEICLPSAPTMAIASCKDFAFHRAAILQRLNKIGEENAQLIIAYAETFGRKRHELKSRIEGKKTSNVPFDKNELILVQRVLNLNTLIMAKYVVNQWQIAAFSQLFFAIVEREVLRDANYDEKYDGSPRHSSFLTAANGYNMAYSHQECVALKTIGKQVGYKIRHAQFGRLMIWSCALYHEMMTLFQNNFVAPELLYAPVYVLMHNLANDDLNSVLEYFVRLMYCSLCGDIKTMQQLELAREGLDTNRPLEPIDVERHLKTLTAIAQGEFWYKTKFEKPETEDDDNDRESVPYNDRESRPHQRNVVERYSSVPLMNIFESISQTSAFGNFQTEQESARCVWVVWLHTAMQVFSLLYCVERAQVGSKNIQQSAELASLLVMLPQPHILSALFSAVDRFIVHQYDSLLTQYGFDLNRHSLITKLRRFIIDLTQTFCYCDTVMLQSPTVGGTLKKLMMK